MDSEYLERLVAVEQITKLNSKKIDETDLKNSEQDKKINELSDIYVALTRIDTKLENVEKICTTNSQDIRELQEVPKKRLDSIWAVVMSAIITGLITYTFTVLGLK